MKCWNCGIVISGCCENVREGTCDTGGKQGMSGEVRGASDQLLPVRGPAEYGGV